MFEYPSLHLSCWYLWHDVVEDGQAVGWLDWIRLVPLHWSAKPVVSSSASEGRSPSATLPPCPLPAARHPRRWPWERGSWGIPCLHCDTFTPGACAGAQWRPCHPPSPQRNQAVCDWTDDCRMSPPRQNHSLSNSDFTAGSSLSCQFKLEVSICAYAYVHMCTLEVHMISCRNAEAVGVVDPRQQKLEWGTSEHL